MLWVCMLLSAALGLTACDEADIGAANPPETTAVPETPSAPENPVEPAFCVKVTDAPYNAKGNGRTNDRAAIQAAIDAAEQAGGGTVILPANRTFLSGNIILKSNVTLFFEKNAKLKQSDDPDDYVKFENGKYVTAQPLYGHDVEDSGKKWNHA